MEYYVKTMCTKTYNFCTTTLPCDCHVKSFKQQKKRLRDALK